MIKRNSTVSAPILVLIVFIMLIVFRLFPLPGNTEYRIFSSSIVLDILIFVLPGMFYVRMSGKSFRSKMKIRLFSAGKIFLLICLLALIVLGNVLIGVFFYKIGLSSDQSTNTSYLLAGVTAEADSVFGVIAMALVPAICEEYFFRGILFNDYAKYGNLCAVVMSCLFFAMSHFDPAGFVSYFFGGLMLCFAYLVTRSLIASMFLHFISNLFSLFVMPIVWKALLEANGLLFTMLAAGTLFLIFTVLTLREAQMIYSDYARTELSEQEISAKDFSVPNLSKSLISPTFLACVLVFILAALGNLK